MGLWYSTISRIMNPQAVDGGEEIRGRVQFPENSSRHLGAREQNNTLTLIPFSNLDLWLPDIGPSTALRQRFKHDPTKWEEFQRRYHAELEQKTALLASIKGPAKTRTVTLLYSAKDETRNQAIALRSFLTKK